MASFAKALHCFKITTLFYLTLHEDDEVIEKGLLYLRAFYITSVLIDAVLQQQQQHDDDFVIVIK